MTTEREWVSFEDPNEQRTWVFDVTFLLSNWRCIYGSGCQGVLTGPTPEREEGCCSYGAHFTDDEDLARVEEVAATISPEHWQFRRQGRNRGIVKTNRSGERVTRLVDDACIFLNRPGFPGGAGCALHRAALASGRAPMDLKPDVCWQLPLRRDDRDDGNGHVTSTITEWGRRHWGGGGSEFHWWCTEAPEAFTGSTSVFESMAPELEHMVGADVFKRLVRYLDDRSRGTVPLGHPAVRGSTGEASRA